jgi:hypothetical protein
MPSNTENDTWLASGSYSKAAVATCYVPWRFMEFRDLFGDGSSEGDFHRSGCLHEASPDGTCPNAHLEHQSGCRHSAPVHRTVEVDPLADRLPRERIRSILEAGDEICLEFVQGAVPTESVLAETAHLLRKLRNTGIPLTVCGLSTADKSRLSRLEWRTV